MNLDQLRDSLSEHDPRPSDVLNSMHRKRRAARNRMYAASGGLAVVVVAIVAGLLVRGIPFGAASSSSSSSAASGPVAGAALPAPSAGGSSSAAAAAGRAAVPSGSSGSASCAAGTLRQEIAMAVRAGASVIVGYGTPTGKSVPAGASAGGGAYYAVTLRSVQTLAGPAIRSGSTAWIVAASSRGTAFSPESQTLWAASGELFAIASPAAAAGNAPVGPVLRSAPVINGQVIFSPDECWNTAGLPATQYTGPSVPVFGPETRNGPLTGSAGSGVTRYAVPLAAVEKVARQH